MECHRTETCQSLQVEYDPSRPCLFLYQAPTLAQKIGHILRLVAYGCQARQGQIVLHNVIQTSHFRPDVRQGVQHLGTAVKRRTLQFSLYHICMQEDGVQGITDFMDDLSGDVAEESPALLLARHLLQALLELLLALCQSLDEPLAYLWGECKCSEALA